MQMAFEPYWFAEFVVPNVNSHIKMKHKLKYNAESFHSRFYFVVCDWGTDYFKIV